jgi:membrane protein
MIAAVLPKILARALDAGRFVRFVLLRWNEDRCPQIAGSLAFTTILALVPVFAIVVALLSRSPIFETVMVQIKIFLLLNLLPEIAGRIITVYMVEFEANAGRLTTVGLLFLLGTAVALMLTIDRSINAIWRAPRKRPLLVSLAAYLAVVALGPVFIGASVTITTYVMSLPARLPGVPKPASMLLLEGLPLAVSTLAFFLVYRLIPHLTVPWRDAFAGGVAAAILFEAAKAGFAFYVAHAPMYNVVYGAFAALPLFLLWIYLSWLIVLFGAELAAALGEWRSRAAAQAPPAVPAPE